MKRRPLLATVATVLSLGGAGCGSNGPDTSGTTGTDSDPPTRSPATDSAVATTATAATTAESERVTGTTTSEATREVHTVVFRQCSFRVTFSCTRLVVEPSRSAVPYYLTLRYRDTGTGRRVRFVAGPLTGRVEDPFGTTAFLLVEVGIGVPNEGSVALSLPRACLEREEPPRELGTLRPRCRLADEARTRE
jgi:hypothetical protein